MKYRIDFPDMGCYCVRTDSGYCFCIDDYNCREIIKVPPNVNGAPVTKVFFDYDYLRTSLKKVIITKNVREIERGYGCYADAIPEIIIDEDNPFFNVYGGGLYQGGKLLFVTRICKGTYRVSSGTEEICENAFKGSSADRVILPPSVRSVGHGAFADCKQIEFFDNLNADEIIFANDKFFEIVARSRKSGEVIYKLYFAHPKQCCCTTGNGNVSVPDFERYDNTFDDLISCVSFEHVFAVCLDRLMYPYMLSETAKARYKKFIFDNNTQAVKTVTDADDRELLHFLLELGAVVPENLEELTAYCVQQDKPEFTAMLLAYKGRHFPDAFDGLSLE